MTELADESFSRSHFSWKSVCKMAWLEDMVSELEVKDILLSYRFSTVGIERM